jgi:hypothetical protein
LHFSIGNHSLTTQSNSSALRKASLFYLVFVMFSYTTGGPFGLEDMVTTSGPGMTLIYLLVLPFFWCIPVSLVFGGAHYRHARRRRLLPLDPRCLR